MAGEKNGYALRHFWERVDKNGPIPEYRPDLGNCWIWTSYVNSAGYGYITVNYRKRMAHRVARELLGYPVPRELDLDRTAGGRTCRRCSREANLKRYYEKKRQRALAGGR